MASGVVFSTMDPFERYSSAPESRKSAPDLFIFYPNTSYVFNIHMELRVFTIIATNYREISFRYVVFSLLPNPTGAVTWPLGSSPTPAPTPSPPSATSPTLALATTGTVNMEVLRWRGRQASHQCRPRLPRWPPPGLGRAFLLNKELRK